ncbi:MAG TPA: metal ABC transporter permease [Bacteroidales bacterium]|nr:metal ABC transporter permease [Bacteroidales bacterium]
MENFTGLFEYQYFVNAVIAAALTAITCGIAGTYVVSRRIVFISGGITHASFGGIGIAYFLGLNPVIGAAVFAVLTGLGIEQFTNRAHIRNDSVIAMLWSLGMAIGIIFIYLTPGYAPNLMTYLFGSILTVTTTDLLLLAALAVILILFFTVFYRYILFIAFDEKFAKTLKTGAGIFNYVLVVLTALTIVLNIKIVGIILLLSLLTIPQNAANLFTRDFRKMLIYSVFIGFAGSLTGLIISYYLNIPSGATIIFSLALLYVILRIVKLFMKRTRLRRKMAL